MRQKPSKKQLHLMLAVGGTTAVVVLLWVLMLPQQLEYAAQNARGPLSRWLVQNRPAEEEKKSLMEVIGEQRAELDRLQKEQEAAKPPTNAPTAAPAPGSEAAPTTEPEDTPASE